MDAALIGGSLDDKYDVCFQAFVRTDGAVRDGVGSRIFEFYQWVITEHLYLFQGAVFSSANGQYGDFLWLHALVYETGYSLGEMAD